MKKKSKYRKLCLLISNGRLELGSVLGLGLGSGLGVGLRSELDLGLRSIQCEIIMKITANQRKTKDGKFFGVLFSKEYYWFTNSDRLPEYELDLFHCLDCFCRVDTWR